MALVTLAGPQDPFFRIPPGKSSPNSTQQSPSCHQPGEDSSTAAVTPNAQEQRHDPIPLPPAGRVSLASTSSTQSTSSTLSTRTHSSDCRIQAYSNYFKMNTPRPPSPGHTISNLTSGSNGRKVKSSTPINRCWRVQRLLADRMAQQAVKDGIRVERRSATGRVINMLDWI